MFRALAAACTLGNESVSPVAVSRMETDRPLEAKTEVDKTKPQAGQPCLERINACPAETVCTPCVGQTMVIGRATPLNERILKFLEGKVSSARV